MPERTTLICTVGTSLIYPNLSSLTRKKQTDSTLRGLAQAYSEKNWEEVASNLHLLGSTERICGAEINSVSDLLGIEEFKKSRLYLLHSDTEDGRTIAEILMRYFTQDRWTVETRCVDGLRDDDPKLFRTRGLRNLAKIFGECVRAAGGAGLCAINATGGYKAQIAVAVLMGQALDIPVYYKHERFNAIIPFPPMPVSLDFSLWQRASHMFMSLDKHNACEPWELFSEDWDERLEPLVNREEIDGEDHLELSAIGQIFHETHHFRFQQLRRENVPREARKDEKEEPKIGKHGYGQEMEGILRFLKKITDDVPYVRYCRTTYWNQDLPRKKGFRLTGHGVQGEYSEGQGCVKFEVMTTAEEESNLLVVVADLNKRLEEQGW